MEQKTIKQQYTSKNTSIRKLNYIFRHYEFPIHSTILDYGCGKYDDCKIAVEKQNSKYIPYDPYNRDEITNKNSLDYVNNFGVSHIICANVLNVIQEDEIIEEIIKHIASLCKKETKVIVSIYEGNRSGIGTPTTKGYQRNQKIYAYYKWFEPYFNVVYWQNCFLCMLKERE